MFCCQYEVPLQGSSAPLDVETHLGMTPNFVSFALRSNFTALTFYGSSGSIGTTVLKTRLLTPVLDNVFSDP
jgi:hypothetical protein